MLMSQAVNEDQEERQTKSSSVKTLWLSETEKQASV
jgi:hypothetical protein